MAAGYLIATDVLEGTSLGMEGIGSLPTPGAGGEVEVGIDYAAWDSEGADRTPVSHGGYLLRDWTPDYLDRIILTVDNPAFGTIAGTVDRLLTIWNSFRAAKSVSALEASGVDGVEIVDFPALPFDLLPSSEITWTLRAGPAGSPVIDGTLTFTIGGIEYPSPGLTGFRAIIFAFPPDWSRPVKVSRRYADAIATGLELGEERQALGERALYAVGFTTFATHRLESANLKAELERARDIPVGLPLWTEQTRLTADAAIAATTLATGALGELRFGAAGDFVLLWRGWDAYEVVSTSVLNASSIDLAAGLVSAWPAGTRVLPLVFGKLDLGGRITHLTDRYSRFPVVFSQTPL